MKRIFLDFETYWSDDYTLKKMTPVEYIADPRFEALGCAFVEEYGPKTWVDGPDIPKFLKRYDWSDVFAIAHNSLFDMLILSLQYDTVPGFYGDTLSMARNWYSHKLPSLSLAGLAQHFKLPAKWDTVNRTKGVNYQQLRQQPELYKEVKAYALDDTIKCRAIFNGMFEEGFPATELPVIDMVVRMVTQPKFELDQTVLAEHLHAVKAKKQQLLDACYMEEKSSLMSDPQLAAKLLFLGVNPIPTKISKRTGKEQYAFAKTDKEFTDLLEHETPMVQAIVAARLGHKSTLEETRTERLTTIARLVERLPVPLNYSGAHTHRFSGGWKINLQNLPNDSQLRYALKAPKGHLVVSVDASQIEARINATMAGEHRLIDAFRQGRDVYAEFAETIYGYEIDKHKHKIERFVGKTGILSLGYGSSWPVFQNMCRNKGDVRLTDSEATSIVMIYRQNFPRIVANWARAQKDILPQLRDIPSGFSAQIWDPVVVWRNALHLPNGCRLQYRDLRHVQIGDKFEWHFWRGNREQKIYGAKLVENVVQALAFVHIMEVAKRVLDRTGIYPAHQVHDELIYIVKEEDADMLMRLVIDEMSKSPKWMPHVPLAAEGHVGLSYGDTH
jgi:DNA polymerase I-like protein with 3'-5' exonuclease and polymerase domains